MAIRCLIVFDHPSHPDYSASPYTDEVHYRELAENLIRFGEYAAYSQGFFSTSTRPPLYPSFLSVFTFLTDFSPRAHHFFNLFFDLINLILIFLVGRILFGPLAGILSLTFYAFAGAVHAYLKTSTSEILVVSLILAVLLTLIDVIGRYNAVNVAGFALCFGLLMHARPVFLLLLPALPIMIYGSRREASHRLWQSTVPMLIITILCLPWGIRNYHHHRTVVPVCTVAGWHLGAHARSLEALPVDLMWRYIYDPSRKDYTEGDYYREATRESLMMMMRDPVRTSLVGIGRIAHVWGLREPWRRIFMARSYVYPVRVNHLSGLSIPLFDIEGLFYIAVITALAALFRLRAAITARRLTQWFRKCRIVLIFLLSYVCVHIIGIPMTQYRFVVEPVAAILLIGLILSLLAKDRGETTSLNPFHSLGLRLPFVIFSVTLLLYVFLYAAAYGKSKRVVQYPRQQPGVRVDYMDLRAMQWRHYGEIPTPVSVGIAGIVQYGAGGFQFTRDRIVAERAPGMTAKLFVQKFHRDHRLGIGDLKLNIPPGLARPRDGTPIAVRGTATTDPFREIIIDVEAIDILDDGP